MQGPRLPTEAPNKSMYNSVCEFPHKGHDETPGFDNTFNLQNNKKYKILMLQVAARNEFPLITLNVETSSIN